ncbi:sulfotransferase family protein [Roseovarius confluentis]|uniref:sulfotransferase family protein n=1 Tax=Roseovarius confluentis TaxID=1852027 RepID=UPI001472D204|nr:sulfotransferase family protein [Roseovarius confluentis]
MTSDPAIVPALKGRKFSRSLHVCRRLGLVYVNNPKVACSTIKLTLQRTELDAPDYEPVRSVHAHAESPLLTWPEIEGEEDEALEGRFIFSFVRHPLERLRSAYLNKIKLRQKRGRFRVQAGFDANEVPDFESFVRAVCAQRPPEQNPHWRLQVFNLSLGRIDYHFIGRLERFATDWADLSAQTGLPAQASFAGKSSAKPEKEDLHLSSDALAIVRKAYALDFETLGYTLYPDQ